MKGMTAVKDLPFSLPHRAYVRETRRRMAHAIGVLKTLQKSGRGDLAGVLAPLREQEAAGRVAGCVSVVHLCESADDCLALERLLTSDGSVAVAASASMVRMLLDTCRTIQLHAEAVDRTAAYLAQRAAPMAFGSSLGTDSGNEVSGET